MKRTIITLLILLGCIGAGAGIFIASGVYDVSARVPHRRVIYLLLEGLRDRSVSYHSRSIKSLPRLDDPARIGAGFPHFQEMCRLCHGAPGYLRSEFAEGLYPSPPHLTSDEIRNEITDAELFWVVQNGLKMTGMPAFGDTHSPDQIWSIVAFIRKLPRINALAYLEMIEGGHQHQKD
jgi:hypothetical protein